MLRVSLKGQKSLLHPYIAMGVTFRNYFYFFTVLNGCQTLSSEKRARMVKAGFKVAGVASTVWLKQHRQSVCSACR